jgi:NAD(P)-dependent dehydrogenase (short-subunit alcohol dehydrogenase family)
MFVSVATVAKTSPMRWLPNDCNGRLGALDCIVGQRAACIMLPKSPSFRLDGRRALVTGAGRGIGLAAAAALSEAGAGVTLCARTASEIDAAAEAIRANGGTAGVLVLDVTDVMAASAAIGAAEPFDILVNNAGTNRPKHVSAVSVADFDFVMNLNVRAAYFVAQAVSRRLIQAGVGGSIINISSQMGHVGAENRSVYCASKWAMEGFSKAMALDLARYGIRVNTIAPTFIETPLTKPFFKDQVFKDQVMSKIKLGRLGQVEDLMGAIVYLASDASSLTTGSSMLIDGGWTAD